MVAVALQTTEDIITHLTRSIVEAINARDFDSRIWENVSPAVKTFPQRLSGPRNALTEKLAWIRSMKQQAEDCPDWKIRLRNMTVTAHDNRTSAEVFALSYSSGEPRGIARAALTMIEWKLIKGKWQFVTHEIMPGMDMLDNVASDR